MWGKTLAAIFLAFPAAIAITGLLALLGPGDLSSRTLPILLLFFPLWVTVISLTFLARNGWRAAGWLGLICLLGFGAIHLIKTLGWVDFTA